LTSISRYIYIFWGPNDTSFGTNVDIQNFCAVLILAVSFYYDNETLKKHDIIYDMPLVVLLFEKNTNKIVFKRILYINYSICCQIQMFLVSVRIWLQIFIHLRSSICFNNMLNWEIVNEIITLLILISMTTYLYPKNCRSKNRILIPEGESPHFKHTLFHFAVNFQVRQYFKLSYLIIH